MDTVACRAFMVKVTGPWLHPSFTVCLRLLSSYNSGAEYPRKQPHRPQAKSIYHLGFEEKKLLTPELDKEGKGNDPSRGWRKGGPGQRNLKNMSPSGTNSPNPYLKMHLYTQRHILSFPPISEGKANLFPLKAESLTLL